MTENEIINRLHLHGETMTQDEAFFIMDALEELQQYREIGTIEECRTAVERMKPKKPPMDEEQNSRMLTIYVCPVCGQRIAGKGISKFCYECGQKLDWSE